jgi:hypothetical protein
MNLKSIAFVVLTFLTLTTNAQSEKSVEINADKSVSKLIIQTDSYEELEDFEWSSINEIFKSNDPNDDIKLKIGFSEKLELGTADIEEWSITLSGKTSELESLTERAKNILEKLSAVKKN